MGEFSVTHLLLLGLIFLIFFGPSRLPQLGQSLGKAIRGFKQGLHELDNDVKDAQPPVKENRPVASEKIATQTTTTTQQTSFHATAVNENEKQKETHPQI